MIGFKGFDHEFKCRGFQYEVGKEYVMEEYLSLCEHGFHFCMGIVDCFRFYPPSYLDPGCNRYAIVEAVGNIDSFRYWNTNFDRYINDTPKFATDKIRIIKEIPQDLIFKIVNQIKFDSYEKSQLTDTIYAFENEVEEELQKWRKNE